MKTITKLGLLGLTLFTTMIANASEKLNVKIASEASKILSISLSEVVSGETILIKDLKGEVLFSEKIEATEKYEKVFNFSTLPLGVYYIESKDDKKIETTPITVSSESISLIENSRKTYLAPEVAIEEGVLRISINNCNKEKVTIALYNELGILMDLTEPNTNTLVFGSYEISEIGSRIIRVSVTEGEHNFTKEYTL